MEEADIRRHYRAVAEHYTTIVYSAESDRQYQAQVEPWHGCTSATDRLNSRAGAEHTISRLFYAGSETNGALPGPNPGQQDGRDRGGGVQPGQPAVGRGSPGQPRPLCRSLYGDAGAGRAAARGAGESRHGRALGRHARHGGEAATWVAAESPPQLYDRIFIRGAIHHFQRNSLQATLAGIYNKVPLVILPYKIDEFSFHVSGSLR